MLKSIGLYFRKIDFLNFAIGAIMPIIVLFIVYSSVKSNIILQDTDFLSLLMNHKGKFIFYFFVSFIEEVIFRGIIFGLLLQKCKNKYLSCVIAALIFTLPHIFNTDNISVLVMFIFPFLFFIISDTTQTYNFLVALAFSQMFNLLCERADNVHGGRLPHHVRVLWDEAANTGQVPQLEKLVAVIRSREVSLCLLYQQLAQCKAIYDKHAETILGNMDSVVFLGGREASTIKEISENWLGKATISMLRQNEFAICRLLQPSMNYSFIC